MSIFEVVMLVCFGAAWPFSIWKSYAARDNAGKSLLFLLILVVGYGAGIAHKVLHQFDGVTYLYALNAIMVLTDIAVYIRNGKFKSGSAAAAHQPANALASLQIRRKESNRIRPELREADRRRPAI